MKGCCRCLGNEPPIDQPFNDQLKCSIRSPAQLLLIPISFGKNYLSSQVAVKHELFTLIDGILVHPGAYYKPIKQLNKPVKSTVNVPWQEVFGQQFQGSTPAA